MEPIKKCKHCGTIENLHNKKEKNKVIIYNICKKCNHDKLSLKRKHYRKFKLSSDFLYNEYILKNKSILILAQELNINRKTLQKYLQEANLLKNKKCKYCNTTENLHSQKNGNNIVIFNICKKCYSINRSNQQNKYNLTKELIDLEHIQKDKSIEQISKDFNKVCLIKKILLLI